MLHFVVVGESNIKAFFDDNGGYLEEGETSSLGVLSPTTTKCSIRALFAAGFSNASRPSIRISSPSKNGGYLEEGETSSLGAHVTCDSKVRAVKDATMVMAKNLLQDQGSDFPVPLEILFNYLGKMQQLERADSLFLLHTLDNVVEGTLLCQLSVNKMRYGKLTSFGVH
jgi:hypothetical protein